MGFYFRRSVKVGPVRFNFSKSGVGVSAGVKGFRYGVRPSGRSYIHAGGYGFYFREDLGASRRGSKRNQPGVRQDNSIGATYRPTSVFESAKATDIPTLGRSQLVQLLTESYSGLRYDFCAAAIGAFISVLLFNIQVRLGVAVSIMAMIVVACIAWWENRRRSIYVHYAFSDQASRCFQQMLKSFNTLAECSKAWHLKSAQRISTLQEFKNNAGASNVVDRSDVKLGQGTPPWMKCNVPIPTIVAGSQTIYFFPDCLIIYDTSGITSVGYEALQVCSDSTRFIEDLPPSDAEIIDMTWEHPNKSGGPDNRYSSNRQLPVCLYGEISLTSASGFLLYLYTSRSGASKSFQAGISKLRTAILAASKSSKVDQGVICPWIEIHPERFQTFPELIKNSAQIAYRLVTAMIVAVDAKIKRLLGDDNEILHRFFRPIALAVSVVSCAALAWAFVRFLILDP